MMESNLHREREREVDRDRGSYLEESRPDFARRSQRAMEEDE